ncbi:unnamed protein product [Macrosiphum euphorbiae]|uniref:HAT C-terminal dimerisation domain-containing protein n=1 Tax=Macrosiphum euphorbiae TaxID=13131 RepID=A0AAV0VH59_9HEMI|nr:unnamed protein product [Macrosiphum euphorbiae]
MQKSEPLVHVMYTELHNLLCTLVGRICKTEYIPKSFFNIKVDDLLTVEKMIAVKDIVVNNLIQEEFKEKKMVGKDILFFLKNVQQHYIAAFKHVLETSPIQNSFLKHLQCLGPLERLKSRSCNSILKLSNDLPFDVDDDILLDEWKLLQLDKDEKESDLNRIDIYWKQFFEKKNSTNNLKYPNVTKIVKSCLSLVHGSADVERNFSISGKMLTDERACMNERTLNALLVTKDSLKHYQNKPELVLMTKKLITMAKGAHKHYQNYLEEQKLIKHQKNENKKIEVQIMKQLEETQNKVKENQQEIQEKEKLLKIAREKETQKRGVANKLFEEANKRLKKAILENNIQEAELAHAMLEGVNTVKKEEQQKKKTADALQIQLEKKKASLIQHLSGAK